MVPISEDGDFEDEEKKKREKEESGKNKMKISKRKERFMYITTFVSPLQDETAQQILSFVFVFYCRYRFGEKMLAACQTLEVHLNGSKTISNREHVSYRTITEI